MDDGGAVVDLDVRAHPLHFGSVHEALREDGVAHDAGARGDREKGAHLGLHVGGESRVGFGGDVGSDRFFGAA